MVGSSDNWVRPSFFAMKYLQSKSYRVIPVNPKSAGKKILGEMTYASLKDVPDKIDMVDIFRNSKAAAAITDEAIEIKAEVIWMQLGVRNDEAAARAEAAEARTRLLVARELDCVDAIVVDFAVGHVVRQLRHREVVGAQRFASRCAVGPTSAPGHPGQERPEAAVAAVALVWARHVWLVRMEMHSLHGNPRRTRCLLVKPRQCACR